MNEEYREALRRTAINFLARLFSNCYQEACAAYLLNGRERMSPCQRTKEVGVASQEDDVDTSSKDTEGDAHSLQMHTDIGGSSIVIDDLTIEEDTVAECIHNNILILEEKSLEQLLNWDFEGEAFENALKSFARYGTPLGESTEYFRKKLIYWLDEIKGNGLVQAANIEGKPSKPLPKLRLRWDQWFKSLPS